MSTGWILLGVLPSAACVTTSATAGGSTATATNADVPGAPQASASHGSIGPHGTAVDAGVIGSSPADVQPSTPVRAFEVGHPGDRDHIIIQVQHNVHQTLVQTDEYQFVFCSADPSQDRSALDRTSHGTLRVFNTPTASAAISVSASPVHVFGGTFSSVIGTFDVVVSGQSAFSASDIQAGDEVTLSWGFRNVCN